MLGLILAGAAALGFWGLYLVGVAEARRDLKRTGQWQEPPAALPRARMLRS